MDYVDAYGLLQTLTSARCALVPLGEQDFDFIATLYSDPKVRRFLGGTVANDKIRKAFRTLLDDESSYSWTVRLKANNTFIGLLTIGPHHDGKDSELSYQFLPHSWHQGYARETLPVLLEHAKDGLNLASVIAETQTANTASRRLLERVGFIVERRVERFGEHQAIYRKELSGC